MLHAAHELAAREGVRIIFAKVAAGDMPVLRWWRHRGYALARPGQDVRFHLRQPVICHDGFNGYRLAAHPLDGTVTESRGLLHVHPTAAAPDAHDGAATNDR